MRYAKMATCFLVVLILCAPAWAQRPRGGQPSMAEAMPPDKAKVVWTWEGKEPANEMELDEVKTKKLVDLYT